MKLMNALKGAMVALMSSLLVAILFAYTFRVPIPMGGMIGPFGALSTYAMGIGEVLMLVFMAWLFYGVLGGFAVVPLCGAIAGVLIGRKCLGSPNKNKMIVLWSAMTGAVPVLIMSTLDYILGPW